MRTVIERTMLLATAFPLLNGLASLILIPRLPHARRDRPVATVSVLIPARNEADRIGACLRSVLSSRDVVIEVIVLDDGSTDGTAEIVRCIDDERLHLVTGQPLPEGWFGKPHACAQLATLARADRLLFLDADVRIKADTIARLIDHAETLPHLTLISGIPHQIMKTPLEWLLLPAMQLLLAGYLPRVFDRSNRVSFAAACGQFIMVSADAYRLTGGHAAIRNRVHDGLALARSFRKAGFQTGLVDATDLANCRMYETSRDVWAGLLKNAHEGMAGRVAIVPWTIVLGLGHILPFVMRATPPVRAARAMSLALRLLVALRCRQGLATVVTSPLGLLLVLLLQWQAWLSRMARQSVNWKDRSYVIR